MRIVLVAASSGAVLLTLACEGRAEHRSTRALSAMVTDAVAAPPVAAAPMPAPPATVTTTQSLIRTGELRIKVRDATAAMRRVDSVARAFGGEVADSRVTQVSDAHHQGSGTLRVPADRFDAVLRALIGVGDVKDQSVTVQDVTRAFTDLETRVAVKQQTVARLRAILEKRAGKLSDVLEVERELSRTTTELEQLEGERRYYQSQIAMASINVSVFETIEPRAGHFLASLSDAISGSFDALGRSVGAMIYALIVASPWIVLALVLWITALRRIVRRVIVPMRLTVEPARD